MLWLYLTAIVVMIGGVINAVLRDMQDECEAALEDVVVETTDDDPYDTIR
jgi:uncharacterized BrkB/YihY/UPF0761 family membrane protein